MSRYAYVTSNPLGPVGVFLSRKGAVKCIKDHPEIIRVDRLLRNEPYRLHQRFTAAQFLKQQSVRGKDEVVVKGHLPFVEESYGFN